MEIDITELQTTKGGFRKPLIAKAVSLYGKGWLNKLKKDDDNERQAENFKNLKKLNKPDGKLKRSEKKRRKYEKAARKKKGREDYAKSAQGRLEAHRKACGKVKPKGSSSYKDPNGFGSNWAWKPSAEVKSCIKNGDLAKGNKAKRIKITKFNNEDFYLSREWRSLRVRVIEKYDGCCMMCGRSRKDHGIVIHVDHIKPRSKFPELSLTFENLQLLCADCNIGKGNKYDTDWRPL